MIEFWNQFHLMRPEWLWAALPALLLTLLLWRQRKQSGGWSEVIAPELLPFLVAKDVSSTGPNLLPVILLAWLIAALGASGPSWKKIPQPIHQKQDAIVLVLDLSYSMKAEDLSPSRLDRARQKLLDLLQRRREGQTGLIAYAGDAHVVTPLTDDNATIANLLPVLTPDMMPVPGSNTPAAIGQAIDLMHSAGIRKGQIILVTDGVDKNARDEVEKLLRGSPMHFSILAVGSATGAPLPLPQGGFLKDDRGTIVVPKLDQSSLQALAAATGGRYLNIQIDDSDLEHLLSAPALPDQEQTLALDRTADAWEDQGYLLVLLLLPLVLPLFRRGWIVCLLPLLLFGAPEKVQAQTWSDLWLTPDQQGQRALAEGDTESAVDLFENAQWAGTAAFRGDDFETATEHFSVGNSGDDWYNRGNAQARAGKIDEAIAAYRESLALMPNREDAQENLKLLEQMKQQQQEQEQEQEQEQQNGEGEPPDENQDQQQSGEPGQQNESDPQDGERGPEQKDSDQQPSPEPGDEENSAANSKPSEDEEEQPSEPQANPKDEPEEPGEQDAASASQAEQTSPADEEQDQAMQQWLRRIPDDPSGLLREKFRYESRQRLEQGDDRKNETFW